MHIVRLKLRGWMCFAVEQELRLEAISYAVSAQLESSLERSNFLGKSALLEAVGWVLYGRHRHRTDDEVITVGEPSTEVEVEFDDGSRVVRSRSRGKPTRVWFHPVTDRQGSVKSSYGAEAEAAILQAVGLSEEEFFVTVAVEQRQMSRLVRATPAELTSLVAAWLGLEPLEQAADKARAEAAAIFSDIARLDGKLEVHRQVALGVPSDLALQCAQYAADLDVALQRLAEVRLAYEQEKEQARLGGEYRTVTEEGARLAELVRLGTPDPRAVENAERLRLETLAKSRDDTREVDRVRRLATQGFDGRCPVVGFDCPVRAEVDSRRAEVGARLQELERSASQSVRKAGNAATEAAKLNSVANDAVRASGRLDAVRSRWRDLRALGAANLTGDLGALLGADSVRIADGEVVRLRSELQRATDLQRSVANAIAEMESLSKVLAGLRDKAAVLAEAAAIFGRQGAQRRIAESAFSEIESSANAMLNDAGIELQVSVRWSRTAQGLASHCECGWPFPTSVKAKSCERCGAARGQKVIGQLSIEPSARSGAADDLAGCAVQLAASAWLRATRGSAWEVLMMDEPTSAFDVAHRRAFLASLGKMARAVGARQLFVISHARGLSDALPGQIVITSDGSRSAARVLWLEGDPDDFLR